MEKDAVLYVDDEEQNLTVFHSAFRRIYTVYTALSAAEGLKILQEQKIKVIVSDQRMPEMTGLEFLRITASNYPRAKRIILTGFTDVNVVIDAINEGSVYKYLVKPWDFDFLKTTLSDAVAIYNLEEENKNLLLEVQNKNKELEIYNNNLEEIILQRTSILLDTIAVKDKFFSIVAHDIKAPLNGLYGFICLLKNNHRCYDVEKRDKYINIVHDSSFKLVEFIENLLVWARAQLDRVSFTPQSIKLVDLVKLCQDINLMCFKDKQITFINEVDESIYVYADRDLVTLVIRNLLSNAIKFSNIGGFIKISSVVKNNYTEVRVEDNGVGMSEEQILNAFLPNTSKSTIGTNGEVGTGFGLTLCSDFVERNKGKIWIESNIACGSTFVFTLPLYQVDKR
jgi:two-component system, sensor histidine kinase and response regulator